LVTGTGAEETSRFIQVIDDYQLTAEDATTATKALKEKGLVPTIDTLARLADQYKQIEDPAQRMSFIQDNLGRGGAKWVNVLNQEGDALRKAAGEIDKNLILTDEQIKQAEELRLAQDALNDSIEGVKVATGAWIGTQILHIKHTQDLRKAYASLVGEMGAGKGAQVEWEMGFESFSAQMRRGAAATEYYNAQLKKTGETTQELGQITEEENKRMQKSNADLISGAQDLLQSNNTFAESQAEIKAQTVELLAERESLIKAGWWKESEAVQNVSDKIGELSDKYDENEVAHAEMMKQKLLDMSLEAIALSDGIAGFSEAEAARAQILLETADAGAAAAFKEQQAFVTASEAIAAGTLDAKELDAVLKMMAKGYSIDVVLNTLANLAAGQQAMNGGGSMLAANNGVATPGFAEGGISTGPASGHMEKLHGIEAVIPLESGSIPVQVQSVANSNSIDVTGIISELRELRRELNANSITRAMTSALKRGEDR
jgi:hypothetical protein